MIYQGESLSAQLLNDGIVDLNLNAKGSVNKFDHATLQEFSGAIKAINHCLEAKAVMISSSKPAFLVGADITEFLGVFKKPKNELLSWIKAATDIFDSFEDLKLPTVAAINGVALGGGCELSLACDYRIADTTVSIGLPEVKLGIMPGFGGTVRLPRIIGADNAVEWISTGKAFKAEQAQAIGLLDAIVSPEHLRKGAIKILKQALSGKLDWHAKRQAKLEPLLLTKAESLICFTTCKGMIAAKAGKHYPAPMIMANTIENAAKLHRPDAMALENIAFCQLAKTDAATSQIGLFLADKVLKSKAKRASKQSTQNVTKIAVIGAGIMGGGIAYQSAFKGTPVVMKDIQEDALSLGLQTAAKILSKQVERGYCNPDKMAQILNNIVPSLSYHSINSADLVVEAVVENPKIKGAVLAEVESCVNNNTIITSNTSTISIDLLAKSIKHPNKFCGMHFFNPVHKMPLVEVIRGKETSQETIDTVVAYATNIGKSAIVVNDCPGFYVNRVLFPYFAAFSKLITEGADFATVDKVMEQEFGWPMGPAYLLDVVGIDTAHHCSGIMAEGFPTRMKKQENDPITLLFEHKRLGQKNAKGFYDHSQKKEAMLQKTASPQAYKLLTSNFAQLAEVHSEDIINRLMIPMINEVIRCLEEGIIDSAAEADMGLIYGIGFPPFRGGPIRYLETLGLDNYIATADKYAHLGEIYQVTDGLRSMSKRGKSYFSSDVKTVSQPKNP